MKMIFFKENVCKIFFKEEQRYLCVLQYSHQKFAYTNFNVNKYPAKYDINYKNLVFAHKKNKFDRR